ncbi:MAG: hypothetical protein AAF236_14580 [Verrucomicrobiota bacterium]
MWVELPDVWIVILNLVGIPAIHLGISWIYNRLPRAKFDPYSYFFRERRWEGRGRVYETWLGLRYWKEFLPDAAPWMDGFPKKNLQDKDPDYLRDFRAETCRGEAAHWAQVPGILLTLIWNPWPVAAIVMIVYAFLSNLPCIVLQRNTRHRLGHLLGQVEAKASETRR